MIKGDIKEPLLAVQTTEQQAVINPSSLQTSNDDDYQSIPTSPAERSQPKLVTNRFKAIVATNLYSIFSIVFLGGMKVAVDVKRVNPFDIVLFAQIVSLFGSVIIAFVTGAGFRVQKDYRLPLVVRSIMGCIGITAFSFGAVLVPITIQLTVGNLAPFFAGMLAFCLIGERMSRFEIVAMVVSFGAVILIAFGRSNQKEEQEGEEIEPMFFSDNLKLASFVGILMSLIVSTANGSISVLTRMMQSLSVATMMTYIALISLVIYTVVLTAENIINGGGPLRCLNYTGEQYLWGFGVALFNISFLCCMIVAYQNERSGLITMMGYIGLLYAFLCDTLIFHESFAMIELVGVLIIIVIFITLVCKKA